MSKVCTASFIVCIYTSQLTSSLPHVSVSLRMPNFKGPVAWLRESLAPNVRQQNTEEEIEAARKKAAEKGQLSVFEQVPTLDSVDGEAGEVIPAWKRKTYTEVRTCPIIPSSPV